MLQLQGDRPFRPDSQCCPARLAARETQRLWSGEAGVNRADNVAPAGHQRGLGKAEAAECRAGDIRKKGAQLAHAVAARRRRRRLP